MKITSCPSIGSSITEVSVDVIIYTLSVPQAQLHLHAIMAHRSEIRHGGISGNNLCGNVKLIKGPQARTAFYRWGYRLILIIC